VENVKPLELEIIHTRYYYRNPVVISSHVLLLNMPMRKKVLGETRCFYSIPFMAFRTVATKLNKKLIWM